MDIEADFTAVSVSAAVLLSVLAWVAVLVVAKVSEAVLLSVLDSVAAF